MINLLILKSLNQAQRVHVTHRQTHLLQPVHLSEPLPPVLLQVLLCLPLIFMSLPKTLPEVPTLIGGPGITLGSVSLELHPLALPPSRSVLGTFLAPSGTEKCVTDGLELLVVIDEGLLSVD